ncbi:carbohydrate ABC transporter permease [Pleomorphomonas carboxyditropha]|uniref:carbohydrate ABC transporter permease n=1 Tax=Pleomorphomonas carboxyditropha TaxID=2023338 RepID=UPI001FE04DE3|nr:sugar ABC transporter permease [Pleomorphomonas carboxyditropha]
MKRLSVRTYHALFVTPALVLSIAIVLLPALLTFGAAFSNWDGVSAPSFAGLNNFSSLFADPVFWTAIANNSLWTVIFLTIPMGIALLAASLLMRRQRASAAFQAIFLLPYVLSPVANAMIWQNIILSPVSGLLGFVSKNVLPLQSPLTQPETALYAVAAVDIWHFWGYLTVVFFAAMRQTPEEQLEAALLENASGWQVFRFVTLPNILPTLGLMLVLVTIFSFLTFDYIYLITQGGPARATEMLSTYAYKFAFTSFQVGKAAAVALVMCFFGLIASVVYVRISRASLEL